MTSLKKAVTLLENFQGAQGVDTEKLWQSMHWEQREDSPRRECWMTDTNEPYTYGSGRGVRTYHPVVWHPTAKRFQGSISMKFVQKLEGCFANGYVNERQHLGWHSDNSPEMDDNRFIAILSFGAERDIYFRKIGERDTTKVNMPHGSLLIMPIGFQLTHEHKIPKHWEPCGKRISFTYRGMI
jgi:alkylated DNA repair dioxygenase AlkB